MKLNRTFKIITVSLYLSIAANAVISQKLNVSNIKGIYACQPTEEMPEYTQTPTYGLIIPLDTSFQQLEGCVSHLLIDAEILRAYPSGLDKLCRVGQAQLRTTPHF